MRKIWTKLATVAMILVVAISFSACALFTEDLDKKYSSNIMVAKAAGDDSLTVSRKDLYYAYLEWGYQYASYYSSSNDLLEYITSALINNKILEKESIKKFGELYPAEEALAVKQAYQSLDATIRTYIYEALGQDDPNDTQDASDDAEDEVDEPYKPSVIVGRENGEYVFTMDLADYADEDGIGMLDPTDFTYYVPSVPGVATQKGVRQAVSKIVRNLQSFESGFTDLKAPDRDYLDRNTAGEYNDYFKHLSKAERAVLNREIDRMVKSNQTSILVERITTAYNLGFITLNKEDAKQAWRDYLRRAENFDAWCDTINGNLNPNTVGEHPFVNVTVNDAGTKKITTAYYGCGRAVATNIANKAIDYYIEKTANAINGQKNFPDTDMESSVISSGLTDIYYLPSDVANNLFTVSHILIGFTDEQKETYTNIQAEAKKNSAYNPQNDLNKLYAETKSDGVSAYDILIEVQTALNKASTPDEKARIFRTYINRYNSDPGMQNLDQLNSSSKPQYEYLMCGTTDNNTMVAEFTEASIELFENGTKGAISGLVWTEYGAHIIMYTRDVADFIFTGSEGMENTSIELLKLNYADTLFATLTSYGNRTIFDTLVDAYFTRNSDNYRYAVLGDYKAEHEISIVTSEFKNFF